MRKYYTSVGRNSNLIIGAVIRPDGTLPEADVKALAGFGKLLRERFAAPVSAAADREGPEVVLDLPAPRAVDHVVLQEDIARGERVREYAVEGRTGDAWAPLAQGRAIGHKWIHRFAPASVSALRLKVTASRATPRIRSMTCHSAGGTAAVTREG